MGLAFLPECASAPPQARRRYVWRSTLAGGAFAAGVYVAFMLAEPGPARIAAACFCVLALGVAFYEFYRLMAALDELQRQIHTIALSLAGGVTTGLASAWAVLAAALNGPQPDPIFAIPVFGVAYYLALFFVARRFA
ncbi:MAG: hypothetical protein ACOC05_10115 [Oceanicaulis sp.]